MNFSTIVTDFALKHYKTAVAPRVRPVIAEYVQAVESMWQKSTSSIEEPVRAPKLVDFVNSLNEDAAKRIWGSDTPLMESEVLRVAQEVREPATTETSLVVVS